MTADPFVAHRSLLFTVAYEMLGSAADAEDVLQESWLRWADVDRSQVHDPRAYLIRVVTRQALNRLRTLLRSREEYVGEWLPAFAIGDVRCSQRTTRYITARELRLGDVLGGFGGAGAAGRGSPFQDPRFRLLQLPPLGLLTPMMV